MQFIVICFIFLSVFLSNTGVASAVQYSKAADGVSREAIASEKVAVKGIIHDSGLWITSESVLRRLDEKRDLVLVDVRKKEAFDLFRIPNSINIPPLRG